jgi:hypothetical protein
MATSNVGDGLGAPCHTAVVPLCACVLGNAYRLVGIISILILYNLVQSFNTKVLGIAAMLLFHFVLVY